MHRRLSRQEIEELERQAQNVRFWHKVDMPVAVTNVLSGE
jgi:hypothetical protein